MPKRPLARILGARALRFHAVFLRGDDGRRRGSGIDSTRVDAARLRSEKRVNSRSIRGGRKWKNGGSPPRRVALVAIFQPPEGEEGR